MQSTATEPMKLHAWLQANIIDDKMLWKEAAGNQFEFLNSILPRAIFKDYKELEANPVMVISTHMSKSIELPVTQYKREGMILTVRDNFYDVGATIELPKEIDVSIIPWLNTKEVHSCREGFPDELLLASYDKSKDKKRFSFSSGDFYVFWAAVSAIAYQLKK